MSTDDAPHRNGGGGDVPVSNVGDDAVAPADEGAMPRGATSDSSGEGEGDAAGAVGDDVVGDDAVRDDAVDGEIAEAELVDGDDLDIGELVAVLTRERDEYLDALRRLQADFDNFRKRTVRQQSEALERAGEAVIERLLPVLDALDLALAHAGERSETGPGDLEPAFVQIGNLLRDALAKSGLERIDGTGVEFDPTVHDAVAHVAPEDGAGGGADGATGPVVVETLRAGYRLKDRVLRPAMVKVQA
jgi:molecular chaperone GrpE